MLATLCCLLLAWMMAAQQRTETLLEKNWRFTKGDVADAMKPEFDDTKWETVTVPHDYSIEDLPDQGEANGVIHSGPFSSDAEGGGAVGYTVGGVAWYRRHLEVPAEAAGRRFLLLFDAALKLEI